MRRERKNDSKVKVLTAATLATLLAAGTLNAYASGADRLAVQFGTPGNLTYQYFTTAQLTGPSGAYFRDYIIGAFNANQSVLRSINEAPWVQISRDLSPGDMNQGVLLVDQPAVEPYVL